MLKEILIGIYLNSSSFFASFLLISLIVSRRQSNLEKIICAYLLHINNIILILFLLHSLPNGITTTNIFIASQLYLIFSLILRFLRKRPISCPRRSSIKLPKNKIILTLMIILLVDLLVNFYSIYIYPPVDSDTLAYHLQSPPNWYQSKNLNFFLSNEHRTMLLSDNLSFLSFWLFLTFKSDIFIEIAPYSMLIFGTIAIFYLLQTLHKNSSRNFVFSMLYYFGGSYISHFSKNFTGDIGLAAFTFSSLALLYAYLHKKSYLCFFFFSLSNGLLLGTKSLGPLSVSLIYLLAFFGEIFQRKKGTLKRLVLIYLYSIVICLIIGGFFYFRNIYYFNNPFYGKEINLFNLIRLPGTNLQAYQPFGLNLAKGVNLSLGLFKNLLSGALGYQITIFYIPAVVTLFLFYRKSVNKLNLLIVLYPIILSFLFLSLFGDNPPRYFFSLNLTGIVSLAILFRTMKDKNIIKIGYSLVVLFILFISVQKNLSSPIIKSLLNQNLPVKPEVIPYYDGDYYFFFNNISQGTTLAYLLPENAFLYPFYGSRYENRLIYTNSADYDKIVEIFKKNNAEYFMGKKPEGDLSNSFLLTDLRKKTIENIPEAKVYATVAELTKNGVLTQIGSGTRINFYKINKTSYEKN